MCGETPKAYTGAALPLCVTRLGRAVNRTNGTLLSHLSRCLAYKPTHYVDIDKPLTYHFISVTSSFGGMMNNLPVNLYFAHAYALRDDEMALRTELMSWLPNAIIDAHAHCNLSEHVLSISERALAHMLSTFPYFSLDDSRQLHTLFFPGKQLRSLRFAKTFRGLDHRAANSYLLERSPAEDRVAVFGLPEDVAYTTNMLAHPRTAALKMYWSYVEPPAQRVYDFFRKEILEEAQGRDIPIILHPPKMLVASLDDILQVIDDFPRLRIVIAHCGLSKLLVPGLDTAMQTLAQHDTVFMDTALNPSVEVVTLALHVFGFTRVMFGSDEPLNLIRSTAYAHPRKGQRIVPDYPYHWVDMAEFREYGHLAHSATHAHWQALLAIRGAIEQLPYNERATAKQWVFHDAAQSVYGF